MRDDGEDAGLWDRGLQNERTSLAWARSTLALLGGGLVLARVAYAAQPVLGGLLAFGSLAIAGWILQRAARRYRRSATLLERGGPLPDGRLPAALSLLAVLIGLMGLVLVLAPD
jgi:uncharacterized membrane protein YidH (DUF202 family)